MQTIVCKQLCSWRIFLIDYFQKSNFELLSLIWNMGSRGNFLRGMVFIYCTYLKKYLFVFWSKYPHYSLLQTEKLRQIRVKPFFQSYCSLLFFALTVLGSEACYKELCFYLHPPIFTESKTHRHTGKNSMEKCKFLGTHIFFLGHLRIY